MKRILLAGSRYGRLLVLADMPSEINGGQRKAMVSALCDCGTTLNVMSTSLRSGNTTSCGCEQYGKRKTHGMSKSKGAYQSWLSMRQRCLSPGNDSYQRYGGRGITITERWDSFENFLSDMGERPEGTTLERKDPNGKYEPSNCEWATRKQQARTRRSNIRITHNGETKCLLDWCTALNVCYSTAWRKIRNRGMSPLAALNLPDE